MMYYTWAFLAYLCVFVNCLINSRNDIIGSNGQDEWGWERSKSSCDLSFQLIEIDAGSNKRLPFQHSLTGHLENPTKIQLDWLTLGCWSRCVKSILLSFILFHLPLAHSCCRLQCWLCSTVFFYFCVHAMLPTNIACMAVVSLECSLCISFSWVYVYKDFCTCAYGLPSNGNL